MKAPVSYPFYASLRFRFGLIFGCVLLSFLLVIGLLLYTNVKDQFEKSFAARLQTQANLILQETETNPITIPFPASGEYFSLVYNADQKSDTLFNNLPQALHHAPAQEDKMFWRSAALERTMETGGVIRIRYVLPATDLNNDIQSLQIILFFYFPLAFSAALIFGYFLSGYLLRPVENMVEKANDIRLKKQIHLLEEPEVHDELHRLAVALNGMLLQIQEQDRNQNAFFASASHELRTPLSVMLTELQTLNKNLIPQPIQPVIHNQIAEVQRLSKLVNDFLLLSQLKSGALILNETSINLTEMTIEILEKFKRRALGNGQIFKLACTPVDTDFNVYTDRSQLVTILLNLLGNVVKHGQHNSTVHVRIENANNHTVLTIGNISKNVTIDPAMLVQEFSRQDFRTEGFGLGLWIVTRLCETIGTKFDIQFEQSIFTARIQFETSQA